MGKILFTLFVIIVSFYTKRILASDSLSYSGRLVNNNGSPVTGPVSLKFDLVYSDQTNSILCSQDVGNVELSHGVFHVKLAFPSCSLNTILANPPTGHTVMIRVTDMSSSPSKVYSYQALHSVPYAQISQVSRQLVQMEAVDGQVLSWESGKWIPKTLEAVTSATPEGAAGGALTGSYPNPGLAPIDQNNVINLVSDLASKIGLAHLSATAPLIYNNATGAFSLSPASNSEAGSMSAADKMKLDDLEVLPVADGMLERFSGVLRSTTCSNEEVLKWNSVAGWICSPDENTDDSKLPLIGGTLSGDLFVDTKLNLKNGGATNYVALRASPVGVTPYTITLPTSAGSSNQVLTTDGSGVLSWSTPASTLAPSGPAGGALTGTYPDPGLAPIAQGNVINLVSDLASKIGLGNLSATAPLVYNNSTGAFSINAASTAAAGTMSASDKTKVDALEVLPGTDGILQRVAGSLQSKTCTSDEILKWIDGTGWNCAADDDTDATKLPLAGGTLTGDLLLNTQLQFKNGGASNYVTIKASPTGSTAYTMTLPSIPGSADQVLATDASGVLSWRTPASNLPPSGPAGGALSGTYPNPTLAPIAQSSVTNLVSDLAAKIGLGNLSATAPLVYNNSTGAFSVTAATTTAAGSMSAADKTKLNSLETFPAGNGLVERFGGVLRSRTCAAGEVVKWDATNGWICGVDNATDTTKVPLNGGTMTGPLTLSGNPTANLHSATKQYVDTQVGNSAHWTKTGTDVAYGGGNVGVGTAAAPAAKLEINGGIKMGNDADACNSSKQGTMRFVGGNFQGCDGTNWVTMGAVTPPGQVATYAMANCPSGWVKANGAIVSRTTYANLFAAIGTTWGAGDGSTSFKLPDLRGQFIRALDDGKGIDAGRALASEQADDNKSHTHSGTTASAGNHDHTAGSLPGGQHSHSINAWYSSDGNSLIINDSNWDSIMGTDNAQAGHGVYSAFRGTESSGEHAHAIIVNAAGAHTHPVTINASGGTETRPKNIALLYCIKF